MLVYVDREDKLVRAYEFQRNEIIKAMGFLKNVATIIEEEGGFWRHGEYVRVLQVYGKKCMRTDGKQVDSDNLGKCSSSYI